MAWNPYGPAAAGSGNFSTWSAPNVGASGGYNVGAAGGYNVGAAGYNVGAAGHNVGAAGYNVGAAGYNVGAAGGYNVGALPAGPGMAAPAMILAPLAAGTGAGSASGNGFIGGYGPVARFEYATPVGLAPLPWALDFANGDGWPPFPSRLKLNPLAFNPPLEWQPEDWDPGLRFWTLGFDSQLTEWLQDLNLATPGVQAAREFARQSGDWLAGASTPSKLYRAFEYDAPFMAWRTKPAEATSAMTYIQGELDELADVMRDDRARYMDELAVQSGSAVPYFVHLMGFDPAARPWTMELMGCATAIGNLVKMQYKSHYKRVRPSTLCPGLVPPWGPPRHPAFPSGHSTVTHLIALFLLSVPGIAERFGMLPETPGYGVAPTVLDMFDSDKASGLDPHGYGQNQRSPLLWLAWRIAKGRERLGLHYPSDSAAGRRLATLVWHACVPAPAPNPTGETVPPLDIQALDLKLERGFLEIPALKTVLRKAQAEWPATAERKPAGA